MMFVIIAAIYVFNRPGLCFSDSNILAPHSEATFATKVSF